MLPNNDNYFCYHTTERIANFRTEAQRDAQVQAFKQYQKAEKIPGWTARQRLGYLLMRWGYQLAKESQAL